MPGVKRLAGQSSVVGIQTQIQFVCATNISGTHLDDLHQVVGGRGEREAEPLGERLSGNILSQHASASEGVVYVASGSEVAKYLNQSRGRGRGSGDLLWCAF